MDLWLQAGWSDSSKNLKFWTETLREETLVEESFVHVCPLEKKIIDSCHQGLPNFGGIAILEIYLFISPLDSLKQPEALQ